MNKILYTLLVASQGVIIIKPIDLNLNFAIS